jgi:chemotaxis protein MotB
MVIDKQKKSGGPIWAITFGDLMTQILCFFVLMLSFSTTNKESYHEASGSIKRALGVVEDIRQTPFQDTGPGLKIQTTQAFENLAEKLKGIVQDGDKTPAGIDIESSEDRLIMRFQDNFLFLPASAQLNDSSRKTLDKVLPILNDFMGDIVITGHTDNIPINTREFSNNWYLASARASTVANYFIKPESIPAGVSPNKISVSAFGETKPIASNDTEEGRAKNRRVEIVLLPEGSLDNLNSESIKNQKKTHLPPIFLN